MRQHGICNFNEATNISSFGIIVEVILFAVFEAFFVYIFHDFLKFFIDFFTTPGKTQNVLTLLQSGNRHSVGIGCFGGTKIDFCIQKLLDGIYLGGHVSSFGYGNESVFYKCARIL